MKEEIKEIKEKKKFNKKYLMFILPVLCLVLVTAGLIIHYGQTQVTIDVTQPISVVGDCEYTLLDTMAGQEPFLGDAITVSNIADFPVIVQVTDTSGYSVNNGIEVSYVGVLELTKKDSAWIPILGDEIELTYTVVGEEFEFSGVPDGYTLIYYKDEYTVLGDRVANPQPAITVTSEIGSLPQLDDANIDELANYCQNPDNYAHCKGAKLWIVPNGDLTGETLSWAHMFDGYYYETDLIYYFANANGEITVPADSFIEFYPKYTLADNLETGSYTITTSVNPITA